MESLVRVLSDVIRAFKYYKFYIFSKELYPAVLTIVKEGGLSGLVRVRPLGSSRQYFILELDLRNYIGKCKDMCVSSDGLLDDRCFSDCKEGFLSKLHSEVVNKLEELMMKLVSGD